jgi:hypothetical protein
MQEIFRIFNSLCYNLFMSEGEGITPGELERRAIYEGLSGKRVVLSKEVPFNHKWFEGEFHLGPWGSDSSPFGGRPKDRVRVSMPGEKMRLTIRNRVASSYGVITAVIDPEDKQFIGQFGWWPAESLGDSQKKRRGRA